MASDVEKDGPQEGGTNADDTDLHQGGSVRRARQSVNAELPADQPVIGTTPPPVTPAGPQIDLTPSSTTDAPVSLPTGSPQPPSLPIRSALRPRPPTILIPGLGAVSASQWAQRQGNSFWLQNIRNHSLEQTAGRGPPPPRPPRPDSVPPLQLENLRDDRQETQPQEPASAHDHQPKPQEEKSSKPPEDDDKLRSDGSSGPPHKLPVNEVPESSLGAVPQIPALPTRRSANLGPPPSARKGASMYFSQNSYVSPIPEEISEGHGSQASSQVNPTSWGDGPPSYYMEKHNEKESEKTMSSLPTGDPELNPMADSQAGASVSGTSGRGQGSSEEVAGHQTLGYQEPYSPSALSPISAANSDTSHSRLWTAAPMSEASSPIEQPSKNQPYFEGPRPKFLAPPSAISPGDVSPISPATNSPFSPFAEFPNPAGPAMKQKLDSLEPRALSSPTATISPPTSASPSTVEKERKRSAGLNPANSKPGEVKSSQSSLPDLIRRATKLASNLDRNRTASQAGAWDELRRNEKSARVDDSNSISDILAAFPSPSSSSPTGEKNSQRRPSPVGKSSLSKVHEKPHQPRSRAEKHKYWGRRCCGMPLWILALLCVVLLLLIAAAIIIPVTLIVLPQRQGNKAATLTSCIRDFPCINGGTNLLFQKSCRCVCSNGFTGSTCRAGAAPDCATADFEAQGGQTYRNATIGNGIPGLLFKAQANFSIPLDFTSLLSVFSTTNLSCADENQLVTFDERGRRRSLVRRLAIPKLANPDQRRERGPSFLSPHTTQAPLLTPTLFPRDDDAPTPQEVAFYQDGATNVVTSNDILLAGPTSAVVSTIFPTAIGPETPAPTVTLAPLPQKIIDFAQVAVLFILQETSLNDAVVAREHLSDALKNPQTYDSNPIKAGASIAVDFRKLTVDFGNGTLFGG